jgi:hypothetical protein
MSAVIITFAGMLAVPRADGVVTTPLERLYQLATTSRSSFTSLDWLIERSPMTVYDWRSDLPDERLPYIIDLVERHLQDETAIVPIIPSELVVDVLIQTNKTHYYPTSFPAMDSLHPIATELILDKAPPLKDGQLILVDLVLWDRPDLHEMLIEQYIVENMRQNFDLEWIEVSPVDIAIVKLIKEP